MSKTMDPAVSAPAANLADVGGHLEVPRHAVLPLLTSAQSASAAAKSRASASAPSTGGK
jgi:hypothetical protein